MTTPTPSTISPPSSPPTPASPLQLRLRRPWQPGEWSAGRLAPPSTSLHRPSLEPPWGRRGARRRPLGSVSGRIRALLPRIWHRPPPALCGHSPVGPLARPRADIAGPWLQVRVRLHAAGVWRAGRGWWGRLPCRCPFFGYCADQGSRVPHLLVAGLGLVCWLMASGGPTASKGENPVRLLAMGRRRRRVNVVTFLKASSSISLSSASTGSTMILDESLALDGSKASGDGVLGASPRS